jgi:hypothetical protein
MEIVLYYYCIGTSTKSILIGIDANVKGIKIGYSMASLAFKIIINRYFAFD